MLFGRGRGRLDEGAGVGLGVKVYFFSDTLTILYRFDCFRASLGGCFIKSTKVLDLTCTSTICQDIVPFQTPLDVQAINPLFNIFYGLLW